VPPGHSSTTLTGRPLRPADTSHSAAKRTTTALGTTTSSHAAPGHSTTLCTTAGCPTCDAAFRSAPLGSAAIMTYDPTAGRHDDPTAGRPACDAAFRSASTTLGTTTSHPATFDSTTGHPSSSHPTASHSATLGPTTSHTAATAFTHAATSRFQLVNHRGELLPPNPRMSQPRHSATDAAVHAARNDATTGLHATRDASTTELPRTSDRSHATTGFRHSTDRSRSLATSATEFPSDTTTDWSRDNTPTSGNLCTADWDNGTTYWNFRTATRRNWSLCTATSDRGSNPSPTISCPSGDLCIRIGLGKKQ